MSNSKFEEKILLTLKHIMSLTSLGRSTIYNMIQQGTFPKQCKFGRSSRWFKDEIDTWINNHRLGISE